MGGLAFSSGTGAVLEMPRMPPTVYRAVRDECVNRLKTLYNFVAVPVEGPEKKSYGDVDVLVAEPKLANKSPGEEMNAEAAEVATTSDPLDPIIALLGAVASIKNHAKDGNSANVAIIWPEALVPTQESDDAPAGLGTDADVVSKVLQAVERSKETAHHGAIFIQVDVRICASAQDLRWRAFKHAHGDIWNLLGTIIRPYGLTADERGLMVRIPEMERVSQKKARVLLTNEPGEALEFLGLDNYPPSKNSCRVETASNVLENGNAAGATCISTTANVDEDNGQMFVTGRFADEDIWPAPFPSLDAMYEYATTCRMFWLKPETPPATPAEADDGELASRDREKEGPCGGISNYSIESTGAPRRETLKSQDRRRVNQRPVFRRWIDEFLPSLRTELERKLTEAREKSQKTNAELNLEGPHLQTKGLGAQDIDLDSLDFPYPLTSPYTRSFIRASAFASFPGSKERYEKALADYQNEENLNRIKRGLKVWIPHEEWQTTQWRGECAGAFRRILLEGNTNFAVTERDVEMGYELRDERGVWRSENVERFVKRHWKEVGERARAWYGGLYREKMEAKRLE